MSRLIAYVKLVKLFEFFSFDNLCFGKWFVVVLDIRIHYDEIFWVFFFVVVGFQCFVVFIARIFLYFQGIVLKRYHDTTIALCE